MPELKHNFLKGRMNKDLDERLVPNGEYRDALNIEVSTSEGSNVGTVQTTMGNVKISSIPITSSTNCVSKILDEKNDKLYWLISESGNRPSPIGSNPPPIYGDFYLADIIADYDDTSGNTNPVVVDTFYTTLDLTGYNSAQNESSPGAGDGDWISVSSNHWSGNVDASGNAMMDYIIYPGMQIDCLDGDGNPVFPDGTVVVDVNLSSWQVRLSNPPIYPQFFGVTFAFNNYSLAFESFNRPLNFQNEVDLGYKSNIITGINIVDDFIFWTDNNSEPKKINIRRSKEERILNPYILPSPDWKTHSMLTVTDTTSLIPNALEIARGSMPWSSTTHIPLKEEHVTVIRKSPVTTLNLEMKFTTRDARISGQLDYSNPTGRAAFGTVNPTNPPNLLFPNQSQPFSAAVTAYNPFWDFGANTIMNSGWISFGGPDSSINQLPLVPGTNYASGVPVYSDGDILNIKTSGVVPEESIRALVTGISPVLDGGYSIDVLSFSDAITTTDLVFDVTLEQPDPLFEFKLPRFSFRYKYEDGEYSTFAPFSEIAFLPSKFEYLPKKGYNLGMTNNLRKLVIKDFIDSKLLPPDVISVDILYKESGSPNIYTVKTIKRGDFEWDAISDSVSVTTGVRGYLNIESEIIHAILPSNQLLRPWDNVPRKALAQEITKNRLLYGNYLQNYNMRSDTGKPININLYLSSQSNDVGTDFQSENFPQGWEQYNYMPEQRLAANVRKYNPSKSIKTLRTYQLGIVYIDKYGRETPVFSTDIKRDGSDTSRASIYLEKKIADKQTKLKAQIKNPPPSWAKSFKFYIKETSNEYYNLAMDRFYDAEDENIWLSFPSSERNKVDIDTFLILKKEKDIDTFVPEPARYKILAIENEAPTYVKTTEQSYGRATDFGISKDCFRTAGGTNSTGFPRENQTFMYCHASRFESQGWQDNLIAKGASNVYMRMRTSNATSNWYKVGSMSKVLGIYSGSGVGTSTDMYRIDLMNGVFGSDMNITTTDPNNINDSTIIGGLQLELKQNVVEHRAEFDGRFFVKIYKDQLLEDTIIKPGGTEIIYTILDSRDIAYINQGSGDNNEPNKSPLTVWPGSPSPGNYGDNGFPGGTWDGGSTNANDIFNHEIGSSRTFWFGKRGWFIDASDSYTYSWMASTYEMYLGDPKNPDFQGQGIDWGGLRLHLSYTNTNSAVWTSSTGTTAAPTTGAWAGITATDIFGASNLVAEVSFITRLKTVGTLWRWKEDPDQHIYRTNSGGSFTIPGRDGRGVHQMPFGRHGYNMHRWCGSSNTNCLPNDDYKCGAYSRTMFKLLLRRADDGMAMGSPGGPHNARYTPLNMPDENTYFSSAGVVFADQGTCTDAAFNNDETACLQEGGTWTSAGLPNPTNPAPGIRCDGRRMFANSNPTLYKTNNGTQGSWADKVTLEILEPVSMLTGWGLGEASTNPAVWETEPKEDIGLDIYHEIGKIYPIEINDKTNELFAPIGSVVECWRSSNSAWVAANNPTHPNFPNSIPIGTIRLGGIVGGWVSPISVKSWDDNVVTLQDSTGAAFVNDPNWPNEHAAPGDSLSFTSPDGSKVSAWIDDNQGSQIGKGKYRLYRNVHGGAKTLPWFNCYSFGNGVESDRIRDDYNQVTIDNGPKASTTLEEPYLEERRKSGLIYSGIYNSISGINNLNQFIQAEKITKDLNPTYGSIQKLHTRNTDLVTLCEDKILKVLANKDALYEADGNTSLTATASVLGQTTPFIGEYGISKNPESFASESYRVYFTDKSRGAVLRLSQDGLTPISSAGMKDWFSDNLKNADYLIGSYDDRKSTYNLTLDANKTGPNRPLKEPITISFGEKVKGWTSFKSFVPELGDSFNNNYYTFLKGNIWRHHDDTVERNSFYEASGAGFRTNDSTVTVLLNEDPGTVKSFGTLNYEGSQARITTNLGDAEYYNNTPEDGWYVSSIKTNLQELGELEFKDKEDKWFSQIQGITTDLSNVDTREFSVQGIDNASSITYPPIYGCMDGSTSGLMTIDGCGIGCTGALNYDPNATVDDGSCVYCIYGCMTGSTTIGAQVNSNYNPLATCDDGSCITCEYGCLADTTSLNYAGPGNTLGVNGTELTPVATCDDGSCTDCEYGCMDEEACNYNLLATCDDGSCLTIYGCMDCGTYWESITGLFCDGISSAATIGACNFYSLAECDDGSCLTTYGCTDPLATNYDSTAACDDGSCTYCVYGCMDGGFMGQTWWDDPSSNTTGVAYSAMGTNPAIYPTLTYGTTSIQNCSGWDAANPATCDDGSCVYNIGCTDPLAIGYDATACIDDGSCTYCCDDELAQNYIYGCTSPCADITIGDYNQMWINGNSKIWDATTNYIGDTTSIPVVGGGNSWWRPTLFVKHQGVIYFARHPLINIPLGAEPGNPTLPTHAPQTQYPYWELASNKYYAGTNGAVSLNECCVFLGCHTPDQTNYNPYTNKDDGTCAPIIYGCTDNTTINGCGIGCTGAINYYGAANVDDGTCIYQI